MLKAISKSIYPDEYLGSNWVSYVSALEGAISLYLGASLLNIFEALELIVRLVINSIVNIIYRSKEK